MQSVAKPKKPTKNADNPFGRANVKYVPIPLDLWEKLLEIGEKNDFSISWVTRRAIRKYLESLEESREPY